MTNTVTIVYLITSAFGAYILFRYMNIFFDRTEVDNKIEFASYLLYYLSIDFLFLTFNNYVVNMIFNLIVFFLLTFNYIAPLKRRLIATVSIYMILMTVETVVMLTMQHFGISLLSKDSDFVLIAGFVTIEIISYNVMLFLSNFKLVKNDNKSSPLHWLSIFLIPAGTLASALILIAKINADNLTAVIINIIILFLINIFVFYLYDALMKSYDEKMEKALLRQQNSSYLKQLEIINQSQEDSREFRHNIKNHVLSLKTLIENNDNNAAIDYLESIFNSVDLSDAYSKSGNLEIDSIVNYKLSKAAACEIKTNIKINVPEKLNIRPFDLSVVLGNLLDNAIEAACKCKDKFINLSVEFDRNVLYISISNSFDGKLNYDGFKLRTDKDDKENHGIGLSSVQKTLEKYNGAMEFHHKGSEFYTDVLIYNTGHEIKPC